MKWLVLTTALFCACHAKPAARDVVIAPPDLLHPRDLAPYDPCPTDGSACKILPLGDSITFGVGSTDRAGYRVQLFRRAIAAGKRVTFVGALASGPDTIDGVAFPNHHEGHPGYTIKTGNGRLGLYELTAAALETTTPQLVTLLIGTNDIDTRFDLPNAPARFGDLLDLVLATAPTALVIVARLPPTQTAAENVSVIAYNSELNAEVAARQAAGHHVLVVDMYAAFTANASDLFRDNLHPNDAGYALMGDTWYDSAIGALLP
jgi:lysophospholipase L1-like esterase